MKNSVFTVLEGVTTTGYPVIKMIAVKQVIYSNPATTIIWSDDVKTTVYCTDKFETKIDKDGKEYKRYLPSKGYRAEVGLMTAIVKRLGGNTGKFNDIYRNFPYTPPKKSTTKSSKKS